MSIHYQEQIVEALMREPANNFRTRALNFTQQENEILIRSIIPSRFIETNF